MDINYVFLEYSNTLCVYEDIIWFWNVFNVHINSEYKITITHVVVSLSDNHYQRVIVVI